MKKTLIASIASLLLLLVAIPAKAVPCSAFVDRLCNAINNATQEVNRCATAQELDRLDIVNVFGNINTTGLSDDCVNYVFTKADKTKIIASFNNYIDAIANKTAAFNSGQVSASQINEALKPMKDLFESSVNKSRTIQDYIVNISYIVN